MIQTFKGKPVEPAGALVSPDDKCAQLAEQGRFAAWLTANNPCTESAIGDAVSIARYNADRIIAIREEIAEMNDHETNAAIYLGLLGAIYAACTYIATEHDIAGGACFGLLGCLIVYAVGAAARARG